MIKSKNNKKSAFKLRLVSPIIMWGIVLIGALIIFMFSPDIKILKVSSLNFFLFMISLLYWIYFFFGSLAVHKKAPFSAAKIQSIVKEGVYGMVRHPIYSSDIILVIGLFFLIPTLKMVLIVLWVAIVLLIWMIIEEKTLTNKLGWEYARYKKEVPMVVPRYWKK